MPSNSNSKKSSQQNDKVAKTDKDKTEITDSPSVDVAHMAGLLLDTSWRVAVPIISLTMLGHYIDGRVGHKYLYLFIGLGLSVVVVVLLIYRQLCIVFPEQFGSNKKKDD